MPDDYLFQFLYAFYVMLKPLALGVYYTCRSFAQLLVNELNRNVIECISKACSETVAPIKQDIGRAKRRPWWSASTKLSKNRKSLWYGIWVSCNKPREGYVYMCYKLAKTRCRQVCRKAFNQRVKTF